MPQVHKCPVCEANVTKSQFSVGCAKCGVYYHQKCAKVSEELFALIEKNLEKFICEDCSPKSCTNDAIMREILKVQKYIQRMDGKFDNLERKVNEFQADLEKVKINLKLCSNLVKKVEKSSNDSVKKLLAKANVYERRINRADILINGLPNKVEDCRKHMQKIGELVGVNLNPMDINHCCFIKKRSCMLVKFNNVQLRDNLMKNYFKKQPLKLNQIIGGDIESRVYLNDNLSPASSKLQYLCRRLLKERKIHKFQLLNMDSPKAKITKPDGSVILIDTEESEKMLGYGSDAVGDSEVL